MHKVVITITIETADDHQADSNADDLLEVLRDGEADGLLDFAFNVQRNGESV